MHRGAGERPPGAAVDPSRVGRHRRGDHLEGATARAEIGSASCAPLGPSAKIRQWFSRERREQSLVEGREQSGRLLRRRASASAPPSATRLLGQVADVAWASTTSRVPLRAVGDGNTHPPDRGQSRWSGWCGPTRRANEEEAEPELVPFSRERQLPAGGIVVEGLDDMLVRVARCCAPVPGDYDRRLRHRGPWRLDPPRRLHQHRGAGRPGGADDRGGWAAEQVGTFRSTIQVEALDRPRLLRDVTVALSDLGANIVSSSTATNRDRVAVLRFELDLSDTATLDRAITELRRLDGVYDAYRLLPGGG